MEITRRDFLKFVAASATTLGVGATQLANLADAFASPSSPPIIWIQASLCSGCSVSLLNATNPGIGDVLLNTVSLRYHPTVQTVPGV